MCPAARSRSACRGSRADGGTLFLDEIAELPLDTQDKLRRVLQERKFERLGGTRTLSVNVRFIAATNRDLAREVKEGRFLADLHFRLGVFHLTPPPLRARPDDVPLLLEHYARLTARRLGRPFEGLEPGFVARARMYNWPGQRPRARARRRARGASVPQADRSMPAAQ